MSLRLTLHIHSLIKRLKSLLICRLIWLGLDKMDGMKHCLTSRLHPWLCLTLWGTMAVQSYAADNVALAIANQSMHARIQQTVMDYVQAQTVAYPGKVNVVVQPLDSRLRLAECVQLEAFTAQGTRLWGKTHIGVRCSVTGSDAKPWSLYVQTDVQVLGEYAVIAVPVGQGSTLSSAEVVMQHGDLSKLPNGVLTDISMVTGKQASMNLPLGTVLRPELLKSVAVIVQGQTVQLSSSGPGFVVTTDGTAMQAAHAGQVVDVKVSSGQVIKGIAQTSGKVEVSF